MWRAVGDVLKKVLTEKINKKHPLGRSRIRWRNTVENNMRLLDVSATLD